MILRVFSELGVPLSEKKKNLVPCTYLDSLEFQTSLPKKKIGRIITLISNLLTSHQGTKWDLVSLLGHLNFLMRIIPLECSFISRLLLLTSSVPALADPVIINNSCHADLHLWTTFLNHWYEISFFYDCISRSGDMHLFTDAAPSLGLKNSSPVIHFASGRYNSSTERPSGTANEVSW